VPCVLLRRDVSGDGLDSAWVGVRSSMAASRYRGIAAVRSGAMRCDGCSQKHQSWPAICSLALFWADWKVRMAPAQAMCMCLEDARQVTLACCCAMPAIGGGTSGIPVFALAASAEVWCGRELQMTFGQVRAVAHQPLTTALHAAHPSDPSQSKATGDCDDGT
jgi:hypothetical protein